MSKPKTYGQWMRWGAAYLKSSLSSSSQNNMLDARLLLELASGFTQTDFILNESTEPVSSVVDTYKSFIERRTMGEPVAQISGYKEFWSILFKVSKDVLTPRPDSEILIEAVLELSHMPQNILDIGTGSGCLLAALLSEFPNAKGIGVDISDAALKIAKMNLTQLGFTDRISLINNYYTDGLSETFDVIISNPPYIPSGDISLLAPDVRDFEPAEALFAGKDGLDAYRYLSQHAPPLLARGGVLAFEIGMGQETSVVKLIQAGFAAHHKICTVEKYRDLAGHTRVIAAVEKI